MRALVVDSSSSDFSMSLQEVKQPSPKGHEILLRVKAFSLNHADLFQKKGNYPPPPGTSPILGLDAAGIIETVGSHVTRFKPGDKVMCLLEGGGYAEYAVAPEDFTLHIPKGLSFEEAAAIPEVFIAAYQGLFQIGEIQPLQWVLIHAGASGLGTASIQLAKEAGAYPLITASSSTKIQACLDLGAKAGFNHKDEPFAPKVKTFTEGHGVELILDVYGAKFWQQNLEALAYGGALILMATLTGSEIKSLDLKSFLSKWLTVTGTTLRSRSLEYKTKLIQEFARFALPRFENKRLKPIIHQIFSWKEIEKAHAMLESGQVIGKIVMKCD